MKNKVYVVIEHFYDGDDYLINSFKDVKSTGRSQICIKYRRCHFN